MLEQLETKLTDLTIRTIQINQYLCLVKIHMCLFSRNVISMSSAFNNVCIVKVDITQQKWIDHLTKVGCGNILVN